MNAFIHHVYEIYYQHGVYEKHSSSQRLTLSKRVHWRAMIMRNFTLKILSCIGLLFIGIMVVSALIVENIIPPWLFPSCLLPSAIFLDHFFSSKRHSWNILKYSLTGGIFSLILLVFLLMEFEEFRTVFFVTLGIVIILPGLFAPELLLWLIGAWSSKKGAKPHNENSQL